MSTAKENSANKNSGEVGKGEFPLVPEDAIATPEDERAVKMQMRPEENIDEIEADIESTDAGSEDMCTVTVRLTGILPLVLEYII
jgi:hypothetical protein